MSETLQTHFNGNRAGELSHEMVGSNIASKVSLATTLDRSQDSITAYSQAGTPVNLTASGQILSAPGQVLGFYVNSTSSGTVVIKNGLTTAGTAISGTITPAIGYHPYPAILSTGGYVNVANTLNVTFFVIAD